MIGCTLAVELVAAGAAAAGADDEAGAAGFATGVGASFSWEAMNSRTFETSSGLNARFGISTCLYLASSLRGDRIAGRQHLVGREQVLLQPRAMALLRDAGQIGPDAIAAADRVAGGAVVPEGVLAAVEQHASARRRTRLDRLFGGLPAVQPVADGPRAGTSGCRARSCASTGRSLRCRSAASACGRPGSRDSASEYKPELLADQLDVRLLAGEERPARAGVEFLRVVLQHLRRVVLGIDA